MKKTLFFFAFLLGVNAPLLSSNPAKKEKEEKELTLLERYQEVYKQNREDRSSLAADGSLAAGTLSFSGGLALYSDKFFPQNYQQPARIVSLAVGALGIAIGFLAVARVTIHSAYGFYLQHKIVKLIEQEEAAKAEKAVDFAE